MTKLLPEEFTTLAQYIYSVCGIALDATKGYLIETRLGPLVRDLGCGTFSELYFKAKMDASGAVKRRIIDAITTNETLFFRDGAPFDLLRHKLIPDLIDRRERQAPGRAKIPIRIWSAACSTGQEVYSIAIVLKELLGASPRYQVRLLGTDISDRAVAQASRGIYGKIEIERGLPAVMLNTYFQMGSGTWRIRDEIRAMATFMKLNLLDDLSGLGRFDIVFCRNVAIYFSEKDKIGLFERIGRVLEPDGALLIGSTESLTGLCPQYESKRYLKTVFYGLRPTAPAPSPAFAAAAVA